MVLMQTREVQLDSTINSMQEGVGAKIDSIVSVKTNLMDKHLDRHFRILKDAIQTTDAQPDKQ